MHMLTKSPNTVFLKNTGGSLFIFFFLFIMAVSCNGKKKWELEAQQPSLTTYISLQEGKTTNFEDCVQDIHFIPLQTTDSSLLATIDKAIFYKDRYYLLDRTYSSLKVFNTDGSFVGSIGKLGQGPGEFTTLKDFILSPPTKRLLLLCNDKRSLLEFDLNGKYIRSIRNDLAASSFDTLGNHYFYFINQNESPLSKQFDLLVVDTGGKVERRLFNFSNLFHVEVGFSGFLTKNEEGLLFSCPFADTVFQINNDKIYPKYIYSFGENAMPDSIKSSYDLFLKEGLKYAYLGNSIIENDSFLSFSYFEKANYNIGFYNKSRKNFKKVKTSESKGSIFSLMTAPVGLKNGDTFISFMSAAGLREQLTANKASGQNTGSNHSYLDERLIQLKNTDNPILATFKLRSF